MHRGICVSVLLTHVPELSRSSRRVITHRAYSDTVPADTFRPESLSPATSWPPSFPITLVVTVTSAFLVRSSPEGGNPTQHRIPSISVRTASAVVGGLAPFGSRSLP